MVACLIQRKSKCTIMGKLTMMAIRDKDLEVWAVLIPLKYSKCSLVVEAVWAVWEVWAVWVVWVVWVEWVAVIKDFSSGLDDSLSLFMEKSCYKL